jgi:hypothetical protein
MSTPPKNDEDDLSDPGRDLRAEPGDGPQPDYDIEEPNPNADQEALDAHIPFDDEARQPDSAKFDPMAKPAWTWFMSLAWIGWRTSEHVMKCSEDYRADSWRYRSHTVVLPEKPRNRLGRMSIGKRVWQNDGPMNGVTLTNMEVASSVKPEISMADAESFLKNALVEGRLVATAAGGISGEPVQIQTFKWAHLEVNDRGELYSRKAPGKIAYNDLRFMRADIINLWAIPATQAPLAEIDATTTTKRASEKSVRDAIAEQIKERPGLTTKELEEIRKSIGASRDVARQEWRKARNVGVRPVRRGRPSKE